MGERGVTLVEMMITAVIVVTLAAAGYTFTENTTKFQARQERIKDMQIRLQGAMDFLVQDIVHAGYGIIDQLSQPIEAFPAARAAGINTPITPGNNAGAFDANGAVIAPGPDTLGIQRIGQTLGTLNNAMGANTAIMQVAVVDEIASQDLAALQGNIRLITLGGLFTQPLAPGGGSIQNAGNNAGRPVMQFTLAGATDDTQTFPVGFPVEALVGNGVGNGVVYSIGIPQNGQGPQTDLLQNGALFASGIEDLQVAYLLANGGFLNNPGGAPYSAIRVSLTAYAPDPDPTWRGAPRPALEDHAAAAQPDNFHRSTLTRVVELSNDAF